MLPLYAQIIIVAAAGLTGGSFASALSWRIPRGESWAGRERSRCTSCNTVLTARDLVPLFSWLMTRGRCRHCGARIGSSYPLIELTSMLAALGFFAAWGWGVPLLFMLAAVPFLVAHIVIDARLLILPDRINLILAVIFGLFVIYQASVPQFSVTALAMGLAAGIVYPLLIAGVGALMSAVLKKEALGWGDIKFFGVAGLGLGLAGLPSFLLLSGVFGVFTGLFWRWRFKKDLFPFGPAIIMAFYVCLLLRGWGIPGLGGG
ncbi:MAG: prepilin peptidase [Alphaproteobacteria bacterium]|nr:prepilin peptidase [Alphaproteobacteria bacterium]